MEQVSRDGVQELILLAHDYEAHADTLVPGDTNGVEDLFVKDLRKVFQTC
jgi:hypothetical protein